jgi:hypothetical protein
MLEIIENGGVALAYVMTWLGPPTATTFPTPAELELQVGYVVYAAGGEVVAHHHLPVTRQIERTCEVIVVKTGRCAVDLYDDNRNLVATRELKPGDLVILATGGHGFRMQEDTVLLEIKQGPYLGSTEKVRWR